MTRRITFLFLVLLATPLISHAEPAAMIRTDSLYEKPFVDAKRLVTLATGQTVDILKRDGAWYQVKAAGKSGWVRMLSVRRTAAAAAVSAGSLTQIATGRSGTGQIVSTAGVRGMGEENLKEAVFSEAAVAAAERFRVSPADADRFARDGGLAPRTVPALLAPSASTSQGDQL